MSDLTANTYLREILAREAVDSSAASPVREVAQRIERICGTWGGNLLLDVHPSGALEKGTANLSSTHIDFVARMSPRTGYGIRQIYDALAVTLGDLDHEPERRNVALGISIGGINVDIIPAKRDSMLTEEVEIFRARSGRPVKTNLATHVSEIRACGRIEEIRAIKLWRDQWGLDFPSFYLELTVIAALKRQPFGSLADNVWTVLGYLEQAFVPRVVLDPANYNNIVSDELTTAEKARIASAAQLARTDRPWQEIIS